jgi:hypothetical protein
MRCSSRPLWRWSGRARASAAAAKEALVNGSRKITVLGSRSFEPVASNACYRPNSDPHSLSLVLSEQSLIIGAKSQRLVGAAAAR